MTVEEIYEEVWSIVKNKLHQSSIFIKDEMSLWWRSKTQNYQKPFTLRIVNENGRICGKCNWAEKCYGCLIKDHHYWRYLAVDWEIDIQGGKEYWRIENSTISIDETLDEANQNDVLSLESIIKNHQEAEFMNINDNVNCSFCNKPTEH